MEFRFAQPNRQSSPRELALPFAAVRYTAIPTKGV
jgi:hypothetical protein